MVGRQFFFLIFEANPPKIQLLTNPTIKKYTKPTTVTSTAPLSHPVIKHNVKKLSINHYYIIMISRFASATPEEEGGGTVIISPVVSQYPPAPDSSNSSLPKRATKDPMNKRKVWAKMAWPGNVLAGLLPSYPCSPA